MELESVGGGSAIASLITLILIEIVLGIDNIVFISIIAGKLPPEQQNRARLVGVALALVMRIVLLFALTWIMQLEQTVLTLLGSEISWKDIILLVGGLFLIGKATTEIHGKLEGEEEGSGTAKRVATFSAAIAQIVLIDMIFSVDSILTAVGLTEFLWVMIVAVIVAMLVMLAFARAVSDFVNKHPTMKMLALSFLIMIGVMLVGEAFDAEIPKGYVYFAMAFSLLVELLNLRLRRNVKPVQLRNQKMDRTTEK